MREYNNSKQVGMRANDQKNGEKSENIQSAIFNVPSSMINYIGIFFLMVVAFAMPQYRNPQQKNQSVAIIEFDQKGPDPDGSYRFRYESEDHSVREEKGEFVAGIWTVSGMFSWFSPDGEIHRYEYVADDKGYRQNEMESKLEVEYNTEVPLLRFAPETPTFHSAGLIKNHLALESLLNG